MIASIRRTPAATPLSPTTEMRPMSPVRLTCVPPHNSTDQPMVLPPPSPMATTRTSSPYFSPNSARAPEAMASSTAMIRVVTGEFCSTMSLAMSSTFSSSAGGDRFRMGKIEAQTVGRDQRAFLRHVIAEHLAQRLVQKMRGGVILPDRATPAVIDFQIERRAGSQRALLDGAEMHVKIAGALLRIGDVQSARHRRSSRRYRRPGRRTRHRTASG